MEWDTPENYKRRGERLVELIAAALRDIPEDGPFTEEQREHLRELVAEKSELLYWSAYNDSFSRDNRWLYGDYLGLNYDEVRLSIMAFRADANLKNSQMGIAYEKYLENEKRRNG